MIKQLDDDFLSDDYIAANAVDATAFDMAEDVPAPSGVVTDGVFHEAPAESRSDDLEAKLERLIEAKLDEMITKKLGGQ